MHAAVRNVSVPLAVWHWAHCASCLCFLAVTRTGLGGDVTPTPEQAMGTVPWAVCAYQTRLQTSITQTYSESKRYNTQGRTQNAYLQQY